MAANGTGIFREAKAARLLRALKRRCYGESIVPYVEFSDPILRELKFPENMSSKDKLPSNIDCEGDYRSVKEPPNELNVRPALGRAGEFCEYSEVPESDSYCLGHVTSPCHMS